MNMFKPAAATSIAEYLEAVPDERKEALQTLHAFIQKTVPDLKPYFAHNMIGYGSFPYKNYKKEMIEWPTIALANQKNYISIYACALVNGEYVAQQFEDTLGKVSVGKSCVRFKKIEDLNLDVLAKMLRLAAKHPGLR